MSRQLKILFVVMALEGLAIALRLHQISVPSFTVDESTSLFFSSSPDWRALLWDNHPPLYHLLLKAWVYLVPMSELGARSLSVIWSALGVGALVMAGHFSGKLKRGLVAGVLLTGSCLSIRFAQEVRMYAMLEALTCFQLAALLYLIQHRDLRRAQMVFIGSAAASAFTHLFGIASSLMLAPLLLRRHRSPVRGRIRGFVFFGSVLAVLISGLVFFLLRFDPRFLEWQRLRYVLGGSVDKSLVSFALEFGQYDAGVVIFYAITLVASLSHAEVLQKKLARLIITTSLVLIGVAAFFEWSHSRHILIARYFIFLNPYFIWCSTLGLEVIQVKLRNSFMRVTFEPILLSLFLISSARAYDYSTPNWREMAEIAAKENVSLVLTTQPHGFRVPYYSERGILVESFNYDENFNDLLRARLKTHSSIMIIDDALHRLQYHTAVLSSLNQAGIPNRTYDINNDLGGSVFGILVINKN